MTPFRHPRLGVFDQSSPEIPPDFGQQEFTRGWLPKSLRDDPAVMDAFYALTAKHLPLRRGVDYVFVAPEAAHSLSGYVRMGTQIDGRLRGIEMRLQRPTRGLVW